MASLVNSTNILKRINANSSQTLPKKSEEEGTHPNSFYEANATLESKARKICHKKKISLAIQMQKIFIENKKQQAEFNSTLKALYTMISVSSEVQRCSNIQKTVWHTTLTDLLNNCKNSFDKS